MKAQKQIVKTSLLVASALVWCNSDLHAQSGPTITTQPTSQTNLAGSSVTFNVAVEGTGPFLYQWRFNGTNLPQGIINTVAGNGNKAYSGDDGPATNASLYYPCGAALDAAGNLYIADGFNYRIRKVDTNGVIATLAGTGSPDYSGEGGAATNASLHPSGVTLDAAGNLYIADNWNSRIFKVDTHGIIVTVAGGGFGSDGGAATNASLRNPFGVALDAAGNLYIADTYNNRIRKVDTNGLIATIAGNGSAAYSGDGNAATNASLYFPFGLVLDVAGNLFIADTYNNRIRKVDTNGLITTIAGRAGSGAVGDGGPATNAYLYYPFGVTVDGFGNILVADCRNNRVRRVDATGFIGPVAGDGFARFLGDGGPATNASMYNPYGVAVDARANLYIADYYNNRVRRVSLYAGYPALPLTNLGAANAGPVHGGYHERLRQRDQRRGYTHGHDP